VIPDQENPMIDAGKLSEWTELAKRDDWHRTFIGSDIRQMLGEIERLQGGLEKIAKRWPCSDAHHMSMVARDTLGWPASAYARDGVEQSAPAEVR
jgi:hypothetical protein